MATTITNQLLKCWLSVAAAAATVRAAAAATVWAAAAATVWAAAAATVRAAAVATAAAVAAEIIAVAKIELAQHSLAALDLLAALHAAPTDQRPALQLLEVHSLRS